MARGGFLGRIGRAIRNIVAPSPPPPPREPREPEEPREREPRGDPYKEIWREHDLKFRRKDNYQKHLKAFHSAIDPIEKDPDEREVLWDSYIRNMIKAEGTFRRQDSSNMWWRDSGIDPVDFKWQAWREAMGFVGKRRSRTP